MKRPFLKILFISLCLYFFSACDSVKRVAENEHLLTKNTIEVNGEKVNTEVLNDLLYQQSNVKIPLINLPLRLHVYNLARPNIDSIINRNIFDNPAKKERLESFLSTKQFNKYIQSKKDFNTWIKNTGEAPVIFNEDKAKRTVNRYKDYYINNGWFNVEANYNVEKNNNKKAEVTYNINTGNAFILDTISYRY